MRGRTGELGRLSSRPSAGGPRPSRLHTGEQGSEAESRSTSWAACSAPRVRARACGTGNGAENGKWRGEAGREVRGEPGRGEAGLYSRIPSGYSQ